MIRNKWSQFISHKFKLNFNNFTIYLFSQRRKKVTMAELEGEGSSPNEAMFFALSYLPLFELLTMARVCTSFRDAIKNDTLPWLKIVVDRPLNRRLSDDRLLEVASVAKGRLQALVLINCLNITDNGLLTVIHHNPSITKVYIFIHFLCHVISTSPSSCKCCSQLFSQSTRKPSVYLRIYDG